MKKTNSDSYVQRRVLRYYAKNGRHALPWRSTRDPYKILVSEIMLQQTQVSRVIPKYSSFVTKFPTVQILANAQLGDVLAAWSGLGYNRRAKYLHECAKKVVGEHNGRIPRSFSKLRSLPGLGYYTAAAVCVFAYNDPKPLVETNVRTVLIHHLFPKKKSISEAELLSASERTMVKKNPREWYWALMDYGAHLKAVGIKTNKRCAGYTTQPPFRGSGREVRGAIVNALVTHTVCTEKKLAVLTGIELERIKQQLTALHREGIIKKEHRSWRL